MDEVETRRHWKINTCHVVSQYLNLEQPHINAKVESILSVGGPVIYKLIAECVITVEWIYEHLVPVIYKCYGTTNNNNTTQTCFIVGMLQRKSTTSSTTTTTTKDTKSI
jgi:hypothetical protein